MDGASTFAHHVHHEHHAHHVHLAHQVHIVGVRTKARGRKRIAKGKDYNLKSESSLQSWMTTR